MAAVPATAARFDDYRMRARSKFQWRMARAREHFAEFAPLVVKDEMGLPIEYSPMHLAWVWHLTYCWNRHLHSVILSHFGSGKSSGFATPLTTWLLGRNPQARVKFVCAGDEAAGQRVEAAKTIITSPEYGLVFPAVRPGEKWSNRAATVNRLGAALDPSLHARGVETKGIGGRADYIIFDDVVDDLNSQEYAQRKKVKIAVHQKWMSRLDPERGRAAWFATPWHVDDATHELIGMKGWCTLILPVGQDLEHLEPEVVGAGPDYLEVVTRMQEEHDRAQAILAGEAR